MTFPEYAIDQQKSYRIIHLEESYLTEVKSKQITPSKLSETVSSFANSAGGEIYIGISENTKKKTRTWEGFETIEEANGIIHTLHECHSFANHELYGLLYCETITGLVLHITIRNVSAAPVNRHCSRSLVFRLITATASTLSIGVVVSQPDSQIITHR